MWTRSKQRTTNLPQGPEPWEHYLHRTYFDPQQPTSFKGANKLYHAITEDGYRLPLSKICMWLQNQESFSLHKPIHREFKRLRVIIGGLHDQYNANLADMQKLKEKNDGVRFLLIVIYVFSCHLWVEPLLNKTEESVIEAFWHIFQRTPKPQQLQTDRGGEFKGQKVEDYFVSINVKHWSAHNDEMKANYAECIIHTVKLSLWNYMRKVKRYRYVDVLQDMVKSYNDTLHRTISMKPSEVTRGHVEQRLWQHQYKPKESYEKSQQMCKVPFGF